MDVLPCGTCSQLCNQPCSKPCRQPISPFCLDGVVLNEAVMARSPLLTYVCIVQLLGPAPLQSLNILEQAKFVVELLSVHKLSLAEVAQTLSRSKAWVSMRQDLLREMSGELQAILLRGAFPVYAYMYTLRPFMRLNVARGPEIEQFVKALANQHLSVREIDLLAQGYFRGPASLRDAIDTGKLSWSLEQMQKVPQDPDGCQDFERILLSDLQSFHKQMRRLMAKCQDKRLSTRAFFSQANLLTGQLLSQFEPFSKTMATSPSTATTSGSGIGRSPQINALFPMASVERF